MEYTCLFMTVGASLVRPPLNSREIKGFLTNKARTLACQHSTIQGFSHQ